MSKRMGRNPFEKKSAGSTAPSALQPKLKKSERTQEEPIGELIDLPEDEGHPASVTGLITRMISELPAEDYLLSLKARMVARALFK